MTNKLTTFQYAFSFIFLIFFEIIVSPRISIGSAYVNMAVILTVWVALAWGPRTGMVFGFIAGLLTGVLKPMELGWICLLLSATGYSVGNIKEKLVMDPLSVRILTLLVVIFAYNILFLFFTSFELFYRNASFVFLSTLYTALYTTIIGAMVFSFIKYRYVLRNLF